MTSNNNSLQHTSMHSTQDIANEEKNQDSFSSFEELNSDLDSSFDVLFNAVKQRDSQGLKTALEAFVKIPFACNSKKGQELIDAGAKQALADIQRINNLSVNNQTVDESMYKDSNPNDLIEAFKKLLSLNDQDLIKNILVEFNQGGCGEVPRTILNLYPQEFIKCSPDYNQNYYTIPEVASASYSLKKISNNKVNMTISADLIAFKDTEGGYFKLQDPILCCKQSINFVWDKSAKKLSKEDIKIELNLSAELVEYIEEKEGKELRDSFKQIFGISESDGNEMIEDKIKSKLAEYDQNGFCAKLFTASPDQAINNVRKELSKIEKNKDLYIFLHLVPFVRDMLAQSVDQRQNVNGLIQDSAQLKKRSDNEQHVGRGADIVQNNQTSGNHAIINSMSPTTENSVMNSAANTNQKGLQDDASKGDNNFNCMPLVQGSITAKIGINQLKAKQEEDQANTALHSKNLKNGATEDGNNIVQKDFDPLEKTQKNFLSNSNPAQKELILVSAEQSNTGHSEDQNSVAKIYLPISNEEAEGLSITPISAVYNQGKPKNQGNEDLKPQDKKVKFDTTTQEKPITGDSFCGRGNNQNSNWIKSEVQLPVQSERFDNKSVNQSKLTVARCSSSMAAFFITAFAIGVPLFIYAEKQIENKYLDTALKCAACIVPGLLMSLFVFLVSAPSTKIESENCANSLSADIVKDLSGARCGKY